jgi:hypothetical protein
MQNERANDGRVSRASIFFIAFLAAGAILAFIFYPAILAAGGRYLAPAGTGNADAVVPREHPITFHEARLVLSRLSNEKIQSAILVAENFHTRRSYWAYKKIGKNLGIDIIPSPYFGRFKSDSWWQEADGFRSFFGESVKFLYYVFRGHIPIKSLVAA